MSAEETKPEKCDPCHGLGADSWGTACQQCNGTGWKDGITPPAKQCGYKKKIAALESQLAEANRKRVTDLSHIRDHLVAIVDEWEARSTCPEGYVKNTPEAPILRACSDQVAAVAFQVLALLDIHK